MSVPSSSSDPKANASASAQSTSPSVRNIVVRVSNCLASFGCTVKPSGGDDITS
jgi:hypothetical protein